MDLVLKIAALGMMVALAVQLLNKSGREDIGMMAGIAGLVAAGLLVLSLVNDLFGQIRALLAAFG